MYRSIVVGYNGSPQAEDAAALGKLLSDATGASLILGGVYYASPRFGGRDPVVEDAEAEHIRQLEEKAASLGAEAQAVASSSPAKGLHLLAETLNADLVVVGSAHHGRAGQILAGSVGMSLLQGSSCSIAIAPHGYAGRAEATIASLTVGYDGSEDAQMALTDALDLARAAGASIKLVTVAEPPPIVYGKGGGLTYSWQALKKDLEQIMRERLTKAVESLPGDVPVEATLVDGQAETALVEAAGDDSLLVLGSRAYGPVRRVLVGSVSSKLVRTARCPVIVHPRAAPAETAAAEPAAVGSAT